MKHNSASTFKKISFQCLEMTNCTLLTYSYLIHINKTFYGTLKNFMFENMIKAETTI